MEIAFGIVCGIAGLLIGGVIMIFVIANMIPWTIN